MWQPDPHDCLGWYVYEENIVKCLEYSKGGLKGTVLEKVIEQFAFMKIKCWQTAATEFATELTSKLSLYNSESSFNITSFKVRS